jgi:hypothetical protein
VANRTAEFLDSREGETTTFSCRSELPVLDAGDFINMKGDQISFVPRDSLWPITFTIGGAVQIPVKCRRDHCWHNARDHGKGQDDEE